MKLFSVTIAAFLLCATESRAEFSVFEDGVPMAAHVIRPSGDKFSTQIAKSSAPEIGHRFVFQMPAGAGSYDGKPACEGSDVRRKPVVYDSPELKMFDLLVYDDRVAAQAANADRWDLPSVPYSEGDLVNPHQKVNPQQYWARFFDIRCLPTRVHFPVVNGVRYEEYREGSRAFDHVD